MEKKEVLKILVFLRKMGWTEVRRDGKTDTGGRTGGKTDRNGREKRRLADED